ncbi:guanylate kinase [Nitrosomonas sp. PY1]|uniref:guanylate kinase n=1 Tax=Nitrosomonas sp. PY1 TaxID=1803906 RepID=UPI001FC7FD01|nr:guanylate kinase [Nitrosomonas sp. PY1]GKS68343.1 guanylate kinase [Nitrosomonas sp. PY1]
MDSSGDLFIISAPSGAGKTSLVKSLLQSDLGLNLSISHTTRLPRSSEIDGKDYHFVSREIFQRMLNNGEFLESAEVYGNFYGTSEKWIREKISTGQDIVLEIDCQGAKQVQRIFTRSISIFILPPSLEALAIRLNSRGQDDPEVIRKRLSAAREEVTHIHDFNYIIINNQLEYALHELICIIKAERLRRQRQLIKHHSLINQLS